MAQVPNPKYDLEARTKAFALECRDYVKSLPVSVSHRVYADQLIRSSSSPGANYIEANESLSKKDFVMRIKICRKEAKESVYWLDLTQPNRAYEPEKGKLIDEARQLVKIFNAIIEKSK